LSSFFILHPLSRIIIGTISVVWKMIEKVFKEKRDEKPLTVFFPKTMNTPFLKLCMLAALSFIKEDKAKDNQPVDLTL